MIQTQRELTEKKKVSPLLLVALVGLMLSTLLSAYYPSLANAAQQQGPTTITATGVLVGPVDDGDEDPTPQFRLTDEATGRTLNLTSGFVDLEEYAGQRVTIEGVRVPGIDPNAYNVTQIAPAEENQDPTSPSEKATLSFELTVEGEPPADAEFLGFTTLESLMTAPLTDPDGDGIYTGSMTVPKFAPGGPPEPISLSTVRIVQGPPTGSTANGPEYRVIKDFGSVKLDGDKAFSASVSFEDDGDDSEVSVKGTITSISGSTVLVEETPAAEGSGDKGYFTVTDETEITKQQEDGKQVAAAFEDLEVGQIVEAVYSGAIAESYPPQGNAESITILEELTCMLPEGCDDPGDADKATFSFELAVECEPPANAEFLGFTSIESLMTAQLTDPDGDGIYTGSMSVPATSGGQGGPPEPLSLPVRIVQGPPTGFSGLGPEYRVIKDFGEVKAEDRTFTASVSFCNDDGNGDGGTNNGDGSNNSGGSDNNSGGSDNNSGSGTSSGSGGSGNEDPNSGSASASGSAAASGGSGVKTLPATGGTLLIALGAGALLLSGGLLARRLAK